MKKMNKMYEAPMAEVFEMNMPTVLMGSPDTTTTNPVSGEEGEGFEP